MTTRTIIPQSTIGTFNVQKVIGSPTCTGSLRPTRLGTKTICDFSLQVCLTAFSIGTKFGFDDLVTYHVTFIGVSHCSNGFIHHDFKDIGGRAFNVIIPLILANETGPELELRQDGDEADEEKLAIGSYKNEPNVASMVGVGSAVDGKSCKVFGGLLQHTSLGRCVHHGTMDAERYKWKQSCRWPRVEI